ncbi:unnamed protein product [Symbiodinium microadriaticum]|nr:unnamed protein product [Symbiodinium microadriaticum]
MQQTLRIRKGFHAGCIAQDLAQSLYSNSHAVVQAVADEIHGASSDRIQPLLFVVDSILKKVGKDYKVHFADRLPEALGVACQKVDRESHAWMKKMVEESWRKHELLPLGVFDKLTVVFQPQAAVTFQPPVQAVPSPVPVAQAVPQAPIAAQQVDAPSSLASMALESDEVVERRLQILTKIIERKPPKPDELQEIMKVPEIRKAIAMQQKNQRQEAMAMLSQFKQELERRHQQILSERDPRLQSQQKRSDAKDPRLQDKKPQDPRHAAEGKGPARPPDPRRQADAETSKETASEPAKKRVKVEGDADVTTVVSDDEVEKIPDDEDMPLVPTRQFLQGMPSLGFSEAWLRQFMSQMPRKGEARERRRQPVGRKILGAAGEQMVYVDAMSPGEMLLLMQFVFMLEEKLRSTGRSVDLAQRVSHSFSYLQVDLAVDVMLKWVFDGLPFQCGTTGLRFANREKLRRQNEGLKKRKELRQMNSEARGWMDSIPDWVGNRDLVVGPALFRLGGDVGKAAPVEAPAALDELPEERWEVPCDERRSVCPISGERFDRVWSSTLNDWAFVGAVAAEASATRPLRFPPGGPLGPQGLSETAVIFKKSCFSDTSLSRRLEALHDCGLPEKCVLRPGPGPTQVMSTATAKEDPELSLLARSSVLARKLGQSQPQQSPRQQLFATLISLNAPRLGSFSDAWVSCLR